MTGTLETQHVKIPVTAQPKQKNVPHDHKHVCRYRPSYTLVSNPPHHNTHAQKSTFAPLSNTQRTCCSSAFIRPALKRRSSVPFSSAGLRPPAPPPPAPPSPPPDSMASRSAFILIGLEWCLVYGGVSDPKKWQEGCREREKQSQEAKHKAWMRTPQRTKCGVWRIESQIKFASVLRSL